MFGRKRSSADSGDKQIPFGLYKNAFFGRGKLQIKSKYPDYENHKKYHTGFIKVVDDIVAQLEKEGPTIALVAKINTAIAGWLINHISTEDVKVAKHIKSVS